MIFWICPCRVGVFGSVLLAGGAIGIDFGDWQIHRLKIPGGVQLEVIFPQEDTTIHTDRRRVCQAGCDEVITKPYSLDWLKERAEHF